jgi:hypothetical protein
LVFDPGTNVKKATGICTVAFLPGWRNNNGKLLA